MSIASQTNGSEIRDERAISRRVDRSKRRQSTAPM
jgi:hypothetical protein